MTVKTTNLSGRETIPATVKAFRSCGTAPPETLPLLLSELSFQAVITTTQAVVCHGPFEHQNCGRRKVGKEDTSRVS
jgi:hypothetical protein